MTEQKNRSEKTQKTDKSEKPASAPKKPSIEPKSARGASTTARRKTAKEADAALQAKIEKAHAGAMPERREPAAAGESAGLPPVQTVRAMPQINRKKDETTSDEKAAAPAKTEKPEKKAEPAAQKPAPKADGVCTDENAERIVAFLEGLLQHMNSNARIKVYETEKDRYKAVLVGEKLGQFIGRRGETLDAIQQLTNYAVNAGRDKRVRIYVDAENYRAKREQSLENLAHKVAGKVLKYRRSVTLEPMNAYERHVIHAALQDMSGVTTYSIGTEPNRRVVVAFDRGERK